MSGKQQQLRAPTQPHLAFLPTPYLTRQHPTPTDVSTAEAEPRRSVRATKGQHTKSFEELETLTAPKRRQIKKSKKAQEAESTQDDDEHIRCVCGATEQNDDAGWAWIGCESCPVWQHNVCVGISSYEDEIPEAYWCEQCRPEDHKELLAAMARGEKPWEARQRAYEEEMANNDKKKKGGKKGKGKRNSDGKDEIAKGGKPKKSATPDVPAAPVKEKKEPAAKQNKRKSRDESHDTDGKVSCFCHEVFTANRDRRQSYVAYQRTRPWLCPAAPSIHHRTIL